MRAPLPALALAAALAALLSSHTSATPQPHVVYARSCAECAGDSYCEFGLPDAPADHVTCVNDAGGERSLYRRYDPPPPPPPPVTYTDCGALRTCCSGSDPTGPSEPTDTAGCAAFCTARPGCTHWDFAGGTCTAYSGCSSYFEDDGFLFAKDPAACPGAAC